MALIRSRRNRMIAGVCGGLAQSLGWDPTLVRHPLRRRVRDLGGVPRDPGLPGPLGGHAAGQRLRAGRSAAQAGSNSPRQRSSSVSAVHSRSSAAYASAWILLERAVGGAVAPGVGDDVTARGAAVAEQRRAHVPFAAPEEAHPIALGAVAALELGLTAAAHAKLPHHVERHAGQDGRAYVMR